MKTNQVLLCALLWLDSVFQVPIPLLYHPADPRADPASCTEQSCSWPAVCLQNATAITRAADAAGVGVALGSVDLAPVIAFLIIMTLQLLINSSWYRALEQSTAVSERHARERGASWFASERRHRAKATVARRAELERSRTRVRELRKMMSAAKDDNGRTLASFKSAPASPLYTGASLNEGLGEGAGGGTTRGMAAGSPSQRSQSFIAEKAAVILATPNLPLTSTAEEEVAGDCDAPAERAQEMRDAQGSISTGGGGQPRGGIGARSGGSRLIEGNVEGLAQGLVRTVLTVHLELMFSLRQTGPFLDFDKAGKPLEPLEGLSISGLLVLSVDELGYFVGTYTHMMCYGALVLSHAFLCTPASGVAVLFVLVMATLQVPALLLAHMARCARVPTSSPASCTSTLNAPGGMLAPGHTSAMHPRLAGAQQH